MKTARVPCRVGFHRSDQNPGRHLQDQKVAHEDVEVHTFTFLRHAFTGEVIKEHVARLQILMSSNPVVSSQSKGADNLD
jgi:hypothetical protein